MPTEIRSRGSRRWRLYKTSTGRSPVGQFLAALDDADLAEVAAAMKTVAILGTVEARHLRGDIYEVRASLENRAFRVLFATEGRRSQVLLALEGFEKKTQKTPIRTIELAETRLADWRSRGRKLSTS
jgi:phage-related protein